MKLITRKKTLIGLLLIFTVLAGCGGPAAMKPANYAVPETQIYRQPELGMPETDYKIQAGDTLDIKFFYNPELNETDLPVRPDGRISLQLVDEIPVLGLTPNSLRHLLKKKYEATELKDVEVAVIVRSFSHQNVFVDGEVGLPTLVPMIDQLTVMRAIAYAKGLRDTARRREVIVIRSGRDYKPMIKTVNLEKVLDGTDISQDIPLMPSDIVYVPKSPACER